MTDVELQKGMDDLNDALQHVVQMYASKNGVSAVAANWVIGFDQRFYTGEGGYAGASISWMGRQEQPRYISEAIAVQVADYLVNPSHYAPQPARDE